MAQLKTGLAKLAWLNWLAAFSLANGNTKPKPAVGNTSYLMHIVMLF